LRLCLGDLRGRASFARLFVSAFGHGQLFARRGGGIGSLRERLGERSALVVEPRELLDELISARGQTLRQRVGVHHLTFRALTTTRQLTVMLGGATRVDLRRFERR
jgi:hypothetical protein